MSYSMSKPLMYTLWIASPIAFAAFFAWGHVINNYWMPIGLFIAYFIIIFGASFYMGYRAYSRNRAESEQYRKRQALSRLSGDDIRKAMERDLELPKEYSSLGRKMFLSLLVLIVLLIAVIFLYSLIFDRILGVVSAYMSGLNMSPKTLSFMEYFVTYLVVFGIWFLVFYLTARLTGIPYLTQGASAMQNIPYIPSKGVVFYRDAMILDDLYVIKAPIDAEKVIVDERRRFIEISLKSNTSGLPYRRLRIYARDPRGVWEKYVSKYLTATQIPVEEVRRQETEVEKPREYRCPYCGALLSEDWEYCPKCGRKIPWDELKGRY